MENDFQDGAYNPFAGTGAKEQSAGNQNWLMLRSYKNAVGEDCAALSIKEPDGTFRNVEVSGIITGAKIRFSPGMKDKDISPQWEFVLRISTLDDEGQQDTVMGHTGLFKHYNLSVGMGRHRALFNLLNVLSAAAENPDWDGFVSMRGYASQKGAMMLYVKANRNATEKPKTKYQFNEETKEFEGVPNPRATGVFVSGHEVYDNHERQNFMLDMAKNLVRHFGGTEGLDTLPQLSSRGYNEDGTPVGATPGPGNAPAQGAKQETKAEPVKDSALFYKALNANMPKVDGTASATEVYGAIVNGAKSNPALYGVSLKDVQNEFITHLKNVCQIDAVFLGNAFVAKPQTDGDDLPF